MSQTQGGEQERRGPRRNASGRIVALTDLVGYVLAGYVISLLGLVAFDGLFALLDMGEFGDVSGWLAVIFPAIIFVEQFKAAADLRGRLAVAPAGGFPPLVSGGLGALVTSVAYAVLWHVGLTVTERS